MRLSELFRSAREAKGLKQAEIASACGVSRPAIARFEKSTLRLNDEILVKIAPLLDINPEFLNGHTKNPFKSQNNELIKYVVDKYHVHTDFLLATIVAEAKLYSFYSLYPPLTILERIRHLNLVDDPIYALVIRDDSDNIFLFRCKSNKDFMSWDDRFISVIKEITWMTDKEGSFNKWLISKDLYEKIRDWDEIRNEDFAFLFSEKDQNLRHQDLILNQTEKEFILLAREKRIDLKELGKKLPPQKK
jgi:transcriptional regulator with XRE-family HTH domain